VLPLPNRQVVRLGVLVAVQTVQLATGELPVISVAIVQPVSRALVRHTAPRQIPMVQHTTMVSAQQVQVTVQPLNLVPAEPTVRVKIPTVIRFTTVSA